MRSLPLLLTLCLFLTGAPTAPAAGRPNILIILADDLGYGDLSCYGAKDLRSPHLDRLASEGMRIDPFYANCPVCSPTRAALLTGRYPDLVGVPGVIRTHKESNWGKLTPDATLLPEVLGSAGYHTACIGKWHLGLTPEDHPAARGFAHFKGFLGDMMDDYYKHTRHGNHYMQEGTTDIRPEGHATDLFSTWSCEFIKAQAKADKPWFLYLAYNAPHTPIQPPADWLVKVQSRDPGMSEKRARLVALVEHMDHGIGQVLEALESSDQADDTLVIFTSDNGGQANVGASCGNLRGEKQDMYEGGIRVPFFARWPGRIAPGSKSDTRAASMDLFHTAADVAAAEINWSTDGTSILPTLLGKSQPVFAERDLFFVRREGNLGWMGDSSWAMIRGDWKLVKNRPDQPWELFNLNSDPLEENSRFATKRPQEFNAMTAAMRAHIQAGGRIPWQAAGDSE